MSVYVWGAGTSMFGKQPATTMAELTWQAVREALTDAECDQVEAVYFGTCFGEPGAAQRSLHQLGLAGLPISVHENACASSTHAFYEACRAVQDGRYARVLVVGAEHLTSRFAGAIPVEGRDREGATGLALPALYAMSAARYMAVFGLTDRQLAAVSIKNRRHGMLNPRAQHRAPVTQQEVLTSRMIADPLTLLQCCAIADGAAACIVGRERRSARDVAVRAAAFGTGALWDHDSPHVWGYQLASDVSRMAYERAGLGVEDVDVLEVHDAFTIGEIVTLEALGLAAEGEGGQLARSGRTALGGRQPVNPSGGLLSRGHPLGATGCAQIAEIVAQLRGEAGPRQVPRARVGLVETLGGGVAGLDGNACVVAIFER